jgi:hypothetical protein
MKRSIWRVCSASAFGLVRYKFFFASPDRAVAVLSL